MAREVRLRRAGDCGGGGNGTQHPAPYPPHPCHTLTLGCLWPGPAQPSTPQPFYQRTHCDNVNLCRSPHTPQYSLLCSEHLHHNSPQGVVARCVVSGHTDMCRYIQISTGLAMFTSSGAGAICCSVTTQRPSGRHIYTRQICGL